MHLASRSDPDVYVLWRVIVVTIAMVFILAACSQSPQVQKIAGFAQGTTYHISFWSERSVSVVDLKSKLNKTLAQIDKELSTYRADSYISKFNQSRSLSWQPASTDFIQLVQIAGKINHETGGCYDPTVGPLFELWGFQKDVLHVPTADQIKTVKTDLGMDKIQVDVQGKRIRKTIPGLQIDLSSMGEGYTIGKLSQVLESQGIHDYLVEFGGDMKIRGHKPDGAKWRVAIEKPIPSEDGPKPYRIITINDEQGVTLDTSGTYQHYFDDNGKEYSHILDPRTGSPVTHDLVSASVFGTDPRVSDAWATAMLCLGPQQGAEVAREQNLEVFFIENKNGQLVDSESEALAKSKRVMLH